MSHTSLDQYISKISIRLIVALVILFVIGISYQWSYKCPNDYNSASEYADATLKKILNRFESNPNLSLEEIAYGIDTEDRNHNCEERKWSEAELRELVGTSADKTEWAN